MADWGLYSLIVAAGGLIITFLCHPFIKLFRRVSLLEQEDKNLRELIEDHKEQDRRDHQELKTEIRNMNVNINGNISTIQTDIKKILLKLHD